MKREEKKKEMTIALCYAIWYAAYQRREKRKVEKRISGVAVGRSSSSKGIKETMKVLH
jgi:hypothetical protein